MHVDAMPTLTSQWKPQLQWLGFGLMSKEGP